jgi:hypothetical protein
VAERMVAYLPRQTASACEATGKAVALPWDLAPWWSADTAWRVGGTNEPLDKKGLAIGVNKGQAWTAITIPTVEGGSTNRGGV